VAALETGHWFAAPFAMLFTFGYGYVALFVAFEQLGRRRAQLARDAAASLPPPAPVSGAPASADGVGVGDELAA
jgi:hypothetical protein